MTGWELVLLALGCLCIGFLFGSAWACYALTAEPKE